MGWSVRDIMGVAVPVGGRVGEKPISGPEVRGRTATVRRVGGQGGARAKKKQGGDDKSL